MNEKRTNLVGLSGRSGGGKDLVADIIQYLVACDLGYNGNLTESDFISWRITSDRGLYKTGWSVRKYADKLKDILCLLLGCTRLKLEDREYKETELGPEWWCWVENISGKLIKPYTGDEINDYILVKMTPRKLLQVLGTECGREIIHPNIWVNALFADYKAYSKGIANTELDLSACYHHTSCDNCGNSFLQHKRARYCDTCILDDSFQVYPEWIITDVRFPHNEGKAITDRGGINIGIKRKFSIRVPEYAHLENAQNPYEIPSELKSIDQKLYAALTHSSEELMGDFEWCDYIIENNGTMDDLIVNVSAILKKENIIK